MGLSQLRRPWLISFTELPSKTGVIVQYSGTSKDKVVDGDGRCDVWAGWLKVHLSRRPIAAGNISLHFQDHRGGAHPSSIQYWPGAPHLAAQVPL
jgi:hypothetical protein